MGIRVVAGELEVSRKEGGLVEGQVTSWDKVGVITGAKREARSGELENTILQQPVPSPPVPNLGAHRPCLRRSCPVVAHTMVPFEIATGATRRGDREQRAGAGGARLFHRSGRGRSCLRARI